MRVEDDSKEFKIVLQDTGEIARMAMAIKMFNKVACENGSTRISFRVLELLEEALGKLGFEWVYYDIPCFTDQKFLFANSKAKNISYDNDEEYFYIHQFQEYVLDSLGEFHILYEPEQNAPPTVKPQVSIVPRNIVEKQRLKDIMSALTFYIEEDGTIPQLWIEEMNELLIKLPRKHL